MVVVPEPAVKGGGAFAARAVDGAVGPAGEERADEALCFAVRLRPSGPGAQVLDAEAATAERMDRRDVGGAVIGEDSLHLDPVAAVEGERSSEEADCRPRLLVREHLGVGEAAVVVDGDVDVLPADRAAGLAAFVDAAGALAAGSAPADAFAGPTFDAPQLLDVDVDELAWPRALVAARLCEPDQAEPAQPLAA